MQRTMLILACVSALVLAGCADDPDAGLAVEGGESTVEVRAVDYAFEGLPSAVPAGTQLTLANDSEVEVHELVLVRIPDEEERALPELLQLAPDELMGFVMANLVGVAVAPPGEGGQVVEGALSLTEPGRYGLLCVIPTGADPDEFMAALPESEGPPDVEGGPPHIVQGMHAEVAVDA